MCASATSSACAMAEAALHTLTAAALHRPVAHTAAAGLNGGRDPIVPGRWIKAWDVGSKPVFCDQRPTCDSPLACR